MKKRRSWKRWGTFSRGYPRTTEAANAINLANIVVRSFTKSIACLTEEVDILSTIFVDADGCPVKREVYRVAERYGLKVILVANSRMHVVDAEWIELVVVGNGFEEADDRIVEHASENDIAITADVPLASRCLKKGARVLEPKGRIFTEESIGDAMATRELMSSLREDGVQMGRSR